MAENDEVRGIFSRMSEVIVEDLITGRTAFSERPKKVESLEVTIKIPRPPVETGRMRGSFTSEGEEVFPKLAHSIAPMFSPLTQAMADAEVRKAVEEKIGEVAQKVSRKFVDDLFAGAFQSAAEACEALAGVVEQLPAEVEEEVDPGWDRCTDCGSIDLIYEEAVIVDDLDLLHASENDAWYCKQCWGSFTSHELETYWHNHDEPRREQKNGSA